jgi:hypothetical protein
MPDKDETAQRLADAHFRLDQGVSRIIRIVEPDESNNAKPVKLLEVNSMTPEAGILPVAMTADPDRGVPFTSVVVEVTPAEFDRLTRGELRLPHGWQLGNELFPGTRSAGAA